MRNIGRYEPWLVPHIPRNGRTALDVGANTGVWSADLADRFESVHAFEPDPIVVRAWGEQEVPKNITLWPCAVGAFAGSRDFYIYDNSAHGSMSPAADGTLNTAKRGAAKRSLTVWQLALDDFGFTNVDFVKVDVEGAEHDVLAGARNLMRNNRVEWIVEIHSVHNKELCTKILEDEGYTVVDIPHPHGPFAGHLWLSAKRPYGNSKGSN